MRGTLMNMEEVASVAGACVRRGAGMLAIATAWAAQPALASDAEDAESIDGDVIIVGAARTEEISSAKVDAPLKDIPQSIQVIPKELIQDLAALRVEDVLQQISGVARGNTSLNGDSFIFRGFSTSEFLRNGYPDRRPSLRDLSAIERVEVIKGPASALYGRSEPGGTLNFVTKEPLDETAGEVSFLVDSFGYINPTVDLSTITEDGKLGVRVNGSYQDGGNFRDYSFAKRYFGSAAIVWRPGDDTKILVNLEAMDDNRSWDRGLPSTADGPAPVPISRLVSEPTDFRKVTEKLASYSVEHKFSPGWQVRHALTLSRSTSNNVRTRFLNATLDLTTGLIDRDRLGPRIGFENQLAGQLELVGEFSDPLGLAHKVLIGGSIDRYKTGDNTFQGNVLIASNRINIYDPVYGNFVAQGFRESSKTESTIDAEALYAQDLIEFSPRWKALFSLRYDRSKSVSDNLLRSTSTSAKHNGFSPRAGLVWQPRETVSLYGSYSQSFVPVIGQDFAGNLFKPTIGKQIEAGAKTELFAKRLLLTVAVYRIRKSNISVTDPDNEGFSVQTGEITSKGFEIDAQGSPLPGLDLIANLSVLDVKITRHTRPGALGRTPANVPEASAGLWASYNVQHGPLTGWGVSMGGNYVGRREVNDLGSTFTLAPYVRIDGALRYTADKWRVALKVNNIFNKRHFVNGTDGTIGGIYPGAPRNAVLTSSFQF